MWFVIGLFVWNTLTRWKTYLFFSPHKYTYSYRNEWDETDCTASWEQGQYTQSQWKKITFKLCTLYIYPVPMAHENPLMLSVTVSLSLMWKWFFFLKVFHSDFVSLSKFSADPMMSAEGNVILWWHFPVLHDNITKPKSNRNGKWYNIDPGLVFPAHIVLSACCHQHFLKVKQGGQYCWAFSRAIENHLTLCIW